MAIGLKALSYLTFGQSMIYCSTPFGEAERLALRLRSLFFRLENREVH